MTIISSNLAYKKLIAIMINNWKKKKKEDNILRKTMLEESNY